eukprot:14326187-Alexandrium_andersonii.AAC.1
MSSRTPSEISFRRSWRRGDAELAHTIGTAMTCPSCNSLASMACARWSVTRTSHTMLHVKRSTVPGMNGR